MRLKEVRHSAPTVAVAAVLVLGAVAACGTSTPPTPAQSSAVPADLLLSPADLPGGFAPTQLSVADLVAGNRGPIESAATSQVTPSECTPSADADLNSRVRPDDSAVLAARSRSGALVELVTTARRDVESDIRVTTGRCSTTTTVIGSGTMRGTRIVTRYEELSTRGLAHDSTAVEQSLALRSTATTTLPDGAVSSQIGYAGYAIVARPGGSTATVQLTVSGDAPPAAPTPADAVEPMPAATFSGLFDDAVTTATR